MSVSESTITISGNKEVFIDNYKNIVKYESTCLVIQCKNSIIHINGKNLLIEYYNSFEMRITGMISDLKWE